jgi:hypothetical protein
MTLRKRFKEEVGLKPEVLIANYNSNYIDWLESQLTWNKVEDSGLPKEDGMYLVEMNWGGYKQQELLTTEHGFFRDMYAKRITHWLPIPNIDNTPT